MNEERPGAHPEQQKRAGGQPALSAAAARLSLKALMEAYERQLIQTALAAAAGHQRRAAASLGLLPTTLHEKMKRLGLVKPPPGLTREPVRDDPEAAVS